MPPLHMLENVPQRGEWNWCLIMLHRINEAIAFEHGKCADWSGAYPLEGTVFETTHRDGKSVTMKNSFSPGNHHRKKA